MNDPDFHEEEHIRRFHEGLHFFGTITASVSHELNNVISIIDQTSGLLEDMIYATDSGKPISIERLRQAVESLKRQTQRGLTTIKRLNNFAHGSDLPVQRCDLNNVIENIVGLSRRLTDMKRLTFDVKLHDEKLMVSGNPFLIQQAVFEPIRLTLAGAKSGGIIVIATKISESGPEIDVDIPRDCIDNERYRELLGMMMQGNEVGKIDINSDGDRIMVKYIIAENLNVKSN